MSPGHLWQFLGQATFWLVGSMSLRVWLHLRGFTSYSSVDMHAMAFTWVLASLTGLIIPFARMSASLPIMGWKFLPNFLLNALAIWFSEAEPSRDIYFPLHPEVLAQEKSYPMMMPPFEWKVWYISNPNITMSSRSSSFAILATFKPFVEHTLRNVSDL